MPLTISSATDAVLSNELTQAAARTGLAQASTPAVRQSFTVVPPAPRPADAIATRKSGAAEAAESLPGVERSTMSSLDEELFSARLLAATIGGRQPRKRRPKDARPKKSAGPKGKRLDLDR